ncbi:ATP-binding protein [Acuticoccus sediminis]|uniref:ATP-binding protein n=1 Tax=Acuticoccus sediminis TaxID=2184697 RepID=UPI001CFC5FD6|nr:ATP-binding protein [Acuticoccus sediminis]
MRTAAGAPEDMRIAHLSGESVIVTAADGMIRYYNPAAAMLYGWPPEAVIGRPLSQLAVDTDAHRARWRAMLGTGMWHGVGERHRSAGEPIPVALRWTAITGDQGEVVEVIEHGRRVDVEAQHGEVVEDAVLSDIAAAAFRLDGSALFARSQDPGETSSRALLDVLRVVDANERAMRLFAVEAERQWIVGHGLADFWPAASHAPLAELLSDVVTAPAGGLPRSAAVRLPGMVAHARLSAWRPAKAPETVVLVASYPAEQDRSAWELRLSEERYRNLMHHLPLAVWQVDATAMGVIFGRLREAGLTDVMGYLDDHPELVDLANDLVRVTEVNRRAIELFGGTSGADFLRPVRYIFAQTPEAAKRVMTAHFAGQRTYGEIMKVKTFDGRILDVLFTVTYPTPPEQLDITLLSMEDITEKLAAETQLRQLQSEFTHAARMSTLGEVAGSIAHELKQPLAAIVTNAQASIRWQARGDADPERLRRLSERIVDSAMRASDIIDRTAGMAGKAAPAFGRLDLVKAVADACLLVRSTTEAQGIELRLTSEPDLPPIIGDRVQLSQVLMNLLINATQAMVGAAGKSRRIEVRLDAIERGVVIEVADTGPGIRHENVSRVFERFYTTRPGGMGIGLAICQSIVTAHGGTIDVQNRQEGGAIFRVALPAAGGGEPAALSPHYATRSNPEGPDPRA